MAEIFGAVASGAGLVSLAGQFADGVKKLKDFCDDIRDAPEDIKFTIYQLEVLSNQLEDVSSELKDSTSEILNSLSRRPLPVSKNIVIGSSPPKP